jgi:starvation-inducible DNA-binding protein
MSDSQEGAHLYPTRIDIPVEIRGHLITLLNQTLACTLDLRSQVQQASWNIKGRESATVRTLCRGLAAELELYADVMAERVAVLGGVVMMTVRSVGARSTLQEYPGDVVDGATHVLRLAERLGSYTTAIRSAVTLATEVEDAGTAALYADISRRVDTQLWAVEAYLQQ